MHLISSSVCHSDRPAGGKKVSVAACMLSVADVWPFYPPLPTLEDGAHAVDVTHAAILSQRRCCQINLIPRVAAKPQSFLLLLLLFYS